MPLKFTIGSVVGLAMDELMARLQAAETKAAAADTAAAQAKTDAAASMTRANNAMAKSNTVAADLSTTNSQLSTTTSDLTTLAALAADYQSQLGASIADRASLHSQQTTTTTQLAAVTAQATALAAQIAALTNRVTGIGVTTTPLLALAANVDVVVPLSRTMPDLTYSMDWATSLPRTNYIVTEKARTTSSVTLNLKAGLAVGAGTIVVLVRG